MKRIQAFICTMFLFVMTVVSFQTVQAKVEQNVPEKVRIYTNQYRMIDVTIASKKLRVKDVKSDSDSLKVKLLSSDFTTDQGEMKNNDYRIGMMSEKDGTYHVTLQMSDGTKKQITVYSYPVPFTIQLDGKAVKVWDAWGADTIVRLDIKPTQKNKIKLNVTAQDGNKISKMEVSRNEEVEDEDEEAIISEEVWKEIKNGNKLKVNDVSDNLRKELIDGEYIATYDSLGMYTYLRIAYKDKYTKQEETVKFLIAYKYVE